MQCGHTDLVHDLAIDLLRLDGVAQGQQAEEVVARDMTLNQHARKLLLLEASELNTLHRILA